MGRYYNLIDIVDVPSATIFPEYWTLRPCGDLQVEVFATDYYRRLRIEVGDKDVGDLMRVMRSVLVHDRVIDEYRHMWE